MTTEAANLKLRRVSRSEQYSSGGGQGLHLLQNETHLEGEGQKYCRHPIGSVTQLQRLLSGPLQILVRLHSKSFFYKFLNSAFKSRASLIHLNN